MLSPVQLLKSSRQSISEEKERDLARQRATVFLAKNKADALKVLEGAIASLERRTPASTSVRIKNLWI